MKTLKFDVKEVEKLLAKLKPTDEVMLVGDEGVYLMSFADKAPRTIVYAKGCNPKVDDFDTWWNNKQELFGGDDGGDPIGENAGKLAAFIKGAKVMEVKLTPTTMETTVRR